MTEELDDLMKVPEAIRLFKATLRNILPNVASALVTVRRSSRAFLSARRTW